jgi:hypothetical protein
MDYDHLRIAREEMEPPDRHIRSGFRPKELLSPEAKKSLGVSLLAALQKTKQQESTIKGFDERQLIKIELSDKVSDVSLFESIEGIKVISQESKQIILAFATEKGLEEFEKRLTSLSKGQKVTREDLILAIKGFDCWTLEDRMGSVLKLHKFPNAKKFILDIELWPQDSQVDNKKILDAFLLELKKQDIACLDTIKQLSLVMVRVRTTEEQANDFLLLHRDVKRVDLPPRFGIQKSLLLTDIDQFSVVPLPKDAAVIGILDTGIVSGHPLLKDSVGDHQSYLNASDDKLDIREHGTFVAGLALYGDIEQVLKESKEFKPEFRILSGKVFNENYSDNNSEFIENIIDRAVRDLHDKYGCRIFNLSYGDLNKIYDGAHLRGLGYTLDRLARELNILFVVPTGNFTDLPDDSRKEYPDYLFNENARLLDPATAINVLTVGGYSKYELTFNEYNYPELLNDLPIARSEEPFPYTRCGPSIGGAIKPDVVECAGNVAQNRHGGHNKRYRGLGVISLNNEHVGRMFCEVQGTSFAAPVIAHQAAKLLKMLPKASSNLLRALIGVHAKIPEAGKQLLKNDKKKILNLYGYGILDKHALFHSHESVVTLIAEESIAKDKCHFFELPIPEDFLLSNSHREIGISLAYSPFVKTTRLDYRMTELSFRLILAQNLDQARKAFTKGRDSAEGIKEFADDYSRRWITGKEREKGTLQASYWLLKRIIKETGKIFVVVMRKDANWSSVREHHEPYALVIRLAQKDNLQLYNNIKNTLNLRQEAKSQIRLKI